MKRLGLTLLVLAVISGIAYYVFTHPSLDRAEQLQGEVEKLREQNRQLADKNDRLEKKVVALRDDPRLAERKARESSGLARPGEVVFQFEKPDEDVEVSVTLEVGVDSLELAGKKLHVDQLADALVALDKDVENARLSVEFAEEVDALRQQRVRDLVAGSPLAPAEFVSVEE
jgi:cell division protein FtsB